MHAALGVPDRQSASWSMRTPSWASRLRCTSRRGLRHQPPEPVAERRLGPACPEPVWSPPWSVGGHQGRAPCHDHRCRRVQLPNVVSTWLPNLPIGGHPTAPHSREANPSPRFGPEVSTPQGRISTENGDSSRSRFGARGLSRGVQGVDDLDAPAVGPLAQLGEARRRLPPARRSARSGRTARRAARAVPVGNRHTWVAAGLPYAGPGPSGTRSAGPRRSPSGRTPASTGRANTHARAAAVRAGPGAADLVHHVRRRRPGRSTSSPLPYDGRSPACRPGPRRPPRRAPAAELDPRQLHRRGVQAGDRRRGRLGCGVRLLGSSR